MSEYTPPKPRWITPGGRPDTLPSGEPGTRRPPTERPEPPTPSTIKNPWPAPRPSTHDPRPQSDRSS